MRPLYSASAFELFAFNFALAAMMLAIPVPGQEQDGLRVELGIVADEESEEDKNRGSDFLVKSGLNGEFAITGEPTDGTLQIWPQESDSDAMFIALLRRT